jgi:hypothetical protein
MDQDENPYRAPRAPLDAGAHATNESSLRPILRGLIVFQLVILAVLLVVPDFLSPELQSIRDQHLNALFEPYWTFLMGFLILSVACLIALWWEKRWAAWSFLILSVLSYLFQLMAGPIILDELAGLLDSLADVAVGATLVALFGMGLFSRPATNSR